MTQSTMTAAAPAFDEGSCLVSTFQPLAATRDLVAVVAIPPLEALYRKHGAMVLRRARQILRNDADAQEVLHDVFTTLLATPESFGGKCSVTTFLYRITTNQALSLLRKRSTRVRLLQQLAPTASVEPARSEQLALAAELVQALPEELAQLAIYYYLDEMTQGEIAETMECSRQWVSKLLIRLKDFVADREGQAASPVVEGGAQ